MARCQPWTGHIGQDGYGRLGKRKAHRIAYEQAHGPIPDGYIVDHDCHNRDRACPGGSSCPHRRCVNPDHLVLRLADENVAARLPRDRCRNGHEMTTANSYTRPDDGYRKCRACNRDAVRRYSRKQVAA